MANVYLPVFKRIIKRLDTFSNIMSEGKSVLILRFVLLYSAFLFQNIGTATIDDARELHSYLLTDYNKYIRPVKQQSDQVVVNISMTMIALQEFDEVLEKFSVVGVFGLHWIDENMVWDVSNYSNITSIFVGYKDVWVPEMILSNPSEKLDSFGEDWQLIRYTSNGRAEWFPGDLIKATCSINVYYFPFDIQECHIEVYVWAYTVFEVLLKARKDTIDTESMAEHGSWTITETKITTELVAIYLKAKFMFRLERKPQYIIVTIVLPILFLCLLNVLVFLLPSESGERISYSMTVLLAIAVFMTIVSDTLPKTSEPLPLISYLLMSCLILSALITCVAIISLRLFHKRKDASIPGWILCIYKLHRWDCMAGCKGKTGRIILVGEKHPSSLPIAERKRRPSNKVAACTQDTQNETEPHSSLKFQESIDSSMSEPPVTWQDISGMVDYISLIVSAAVTILNFALFLIITKMSAINLKEMI